MAHTKEEYNAFVERYKEQGLCYRCKEHRPIAEGHSCFCEVCRVASNERVYNTRKTKPEWYLWGKAKRRATVQGVPFTIKPTDVVIPDVCPVLGISLEPADDYPTDSSPSLDKVIPHLGYVPGNIQVISRRANSLKNNATLEELEAIVSYVRDHIQNSFKVG